jgi:ATP-dependent RNA helicase DDX19/DBP5
MLEWMMQYFDDANSLLVSRCFSLHRIGRTGRFGRKGTSITFVSDTESMQALAAIEAHFAHTNGVELIQKAPADPEALADVIEI